MARKQQGGGASGARKGSQSLWERAGARAGDGAGALFASLDAQDALDGQDMRDGQTAQTTRVTTRGHTREQAALSLERLAAAIRAGVWSAELAALVAAADDILDERSDGVSR